MNAFARRSTLTEDAEGLSRRRVEDSRTVEVVVDVKEATKDKESVGMPRNVIDVTDLKQLLFAL